MAPALPGQPIKAFQREGGMITTNNDALAHHADVLRNHGASVSEEQRHKGPRPYILPDFEVMGFNYRMTDLQGAVGVVQIKKLDQYIDERQERAAWYNEKFKNIAWLRTPAYSADYKHGWQSYVLFIDEKKSPMKRNDIMEYLQQKGISTRPGTHAVHMLTFYANLYGLKPSDFPGAEAANNFSMSIPLHNRMSEEDYAYVAEAIQAIS
ncbi:MAG: perosamine synthetase [Bacteroidetes bacterium]|nr:MAG: perosamine synthetase [Bacteroidota bacterium]